MADPNQIRMLIDEHFSLAWCRENIVIPIEVTAESRYSHVDLDAQCLVVAIGDISYLGTIGGFIKHRASRAGLKCQFVEMPPEQIQELIDQASAQVIIENDSDDITTDTDALANAFIEAEEGNASGIGLEFGDEDEYFLRLRDEVDDISIDLLGAPLQRAAAKILVKAIRDDASSIHVEPLGTDYRVLLRQDGIIRPFIRIPITSGLKLTAVLKTMAGMNVAERNASQDGRILRKIEGNTMEFRVFTLPSKYGEKTVLRALRSGTGMLNLETLICNKDVLHQLRSLLELPSGVVFVVGPAGSGKSTTMYSAICETNKDERNIVTAEDQIECTIPDVTQVQLLRGKAHTHAKLIRTLISLDPDVLMCDEILDSDSTSAAFDAATSGALVLAGFNATNIAIALSRIAAMKHPSHKLIALKGGLIAQHLMLRNCMECSSIRTLRDDEVDLTLLPIGTSVRDANCLTAAEKEVRLREGCLCPRCHGVGYKGRVGVYELLPFSEEVKTRLISLSENFSIENYQALLDVKSLLMVDILGYGRALVRDGITTVCELEKLRRSLC